MERKAAVKANAEREAKHQAQLKADAEHKAQETEPEAERKAAIERQNDGRNDFNPF